MNGLLPVPAPGGPRRRFSVPAAGSPSRPAVLSGLAAGGALVLLLGLSSADALERVTLVVPGADPGLEAALRASSLLLEAEAAGVTDPQEVLAAARAEYGRMVGVLYGAGHYAGEVSVRLDGREAAEFAPLEMPRAVREIVIRVDPGPPFVFSRAEVAPLAPGTELPSGFAPGERAESNLIRSASAAAVTAWRRAGHARAAPRNPRLVADHRTARMEAVIPIDPGPVVTFGRLVVRGQERMRESRIRAIAGFPEGGRFDPDDIATAAQRLRRTGAFASVALSEAETLGPGDTLDVTATLIEAPLRRFGFGAEIDSDDGLRISAFWLHRNLRGGAERLRLDAEIGSIGSDISGQDYRLGLRFSRPATFTPETTLDLGILAEQDSERDFDARRLRLDVGVIHIFSDRLTGELGVGYLFERTRDAAGSRSLASLTLPALLRYDRRDDPQNARRGYFLEGGATPFLGLQGGESGGRIVLDARGYVPAGERLVLAARAQVGSVVAAGIERTPRDFLFLSGGSGTVRGQPYRSLGVNKPANGETVLIGGRGFAALSAEARVNVTGAIGVVGFADAGAVSADSFLSDAVWHAGAGLGVRYATGIGPIRVDVAAPLRGPTGSGLQLYIGIGQAF